MEINEIEKSTEKSIKPKVVSLSRRWETETERERRRRRGRTGGKDGELQWWHLHIKCVLSESFLLPGGVCWMRPLDFPGTPHATSPLPPGIPSPTGLQSQNCSLALIPHLMECPHRSVSVLVKLLFPFWYATSISSAPTGPPRLTDRRHTELQVPLPSDSEASLGPSMSPLTPFP